MSEKAKETKEYGKNPILPTSGSNTSINWVEAFHEYDKKRDRQRLAIYIIIVVIVTVLMAYKWGWF